MGALSFVLDLIPLEAILTVLGLVGGVVFSAVKGRQNRRLGAEIERDRIADEIMKAREDREHAIGEALRRNDGDPDVRERLRARLAHRD